ncbi:MAG TPA: CheR family methyltransferase [Candidatus Binatia bacterium]|jgi:chemotaxis protein methyltransferase CheR|nr:CheR family methyltransferase [Candidatus Binatia bacterium]
MNQPLPNSLQAQFAELIANRTGLRTAPRDMAKLQKVLAGRIKCLRLSDAQEYYEILARDGWENRQEWEDLTGPLTTGESYFFRDKGQFGLLRNHILPEIIDRNRQRRSLRIWSAGCSTGEESYSLAILVAELLPEHKNWNVFILGTDINKAAVEKARRGTYSVWSFRGVHQDVKTRYFHSRHHEWELDTRIRSLVHFHQGNLFRDAFPSTASGIHDLDLILCRNVFIYFAREAVSAVLQKFSRSLNGNGYLLTGHTEVDGLQPRNLHVKLFPESLIYQRQEKTVAGSVAHKALVPDVTIAHAPAWGTWPHSSPPAGPVRRLTVPASLDKEAPTQQTALQEAEQLIQSGNYSVAIERLERLLHREPRNLSALTMTAQAHASLGRYDKAIRLCQQAVTANSLAVLPYYLLAHITEHQGDPETAKTLFKKIIYLDPAFTPAYLELGALYYRGGDAQRARKMRSTALAFLKKIPPQTVVQAYGAMTAGELITYVEKMLDEKHSLEF